MTPVKINLAPESRQAYIRRRKTRQKVRFATLVAIGTCGSLIVLLTVINLAAGLVLQQNKDKVAQYEKQIQTMPKLQDAMTAQQRLASIGVLYSQRVHLSQFFDVLTTVSPNGFGISSLTIDKTNTIHFAATANSYGLAAKFVKALEASNQTLGPNAKPSNPPYFTNIVFSSVSQGSNGGVSFSVGATASGEVTSGQNH